MSDLIDRDEVIEIIESVCSADDSYWQPGTLEKIRSLPTHPTPSNTLGALDCVSRQKAIDEIDEWIKAFRENGHKESAADACLIQDGIIQLPSAQPERLTDDDFETIRIHLNAYKEKLCNQKRWKEAEEYQRIIDRFMAFASAQPRKGKWIYGEHESAMCDGYRCNKCGFFVPWDYQRRFIGFIKDYNYCPSCGAKMEVKE